LHHPTGAGVTGAVRMIIAEGLPESPARVVDPERGTVRVGAVQHRWHPDAEVHRAALEEGVGLAAEAGAELVCLPELTLSPYFAISPHGPDGGPRERGEGHRFVPEPLPGGPTHSFAGELAARHEVHVHASLYEAPGPDDREGLGFNTAVCVAPDGSLVARTRKMHIPVTAGYHEDRWFRPGDSGLPVVHVGEARVGFPTCWDQWFPELARGYALAGADLLVYPTAIGSEPDHPTFDTQPLWQQVMIGHAIANGLHVIAVNRIGTESIGDTGITFYGSSFIADPYGRVLVQAPRDEPSVLVADLDLDARRDWLELFPFLATRRPDQYGPLIDG
jgi:N-carbamoylputrescine amidase